jgi:hypothetical protein
MQADGSTGPAALEPSSGDEALRKGDPEEAK